MTTPPDTRSSRPNEIRIGGPDGEIVEVSDADFHQFQILHEGHVLHHTAEDTKGRWIYRSARADQR